MFTLYSENTGVFSLLQYIGEDKCISIQNKTYRFYIKKNTLFTDIIINSDILLKTVEIEKNIKTDFNVHIRNNNIHIVVANKNYDLIYIFFDGESLTREIIYSFDGDTGIPSDPVIKALDNDIHIVVSFIRIKKPRAWSLYSYIKKDEIWRKRTIDTGSGLCYTQHCLGNNNKSDMHCLYKNCDSKGQNIKYSFFNGKTAQWCKPKMVYKNGIDKYSPHIFIDILDQVYFLWIEINDKIHLCIAKRDISDDYNKLEITSMMQSIIIWNDRYHIYALSCEKSSFFYDLCCMEKEFSLNEPSEERREFDMDAKVKLLLDIKREHEQSVIRMKNDIEEAENKLTKEILSLRNQISNYKMEIESKDNRMLELESMVNSLLHEKNTLTLKIEEDNDKRPVKNYIKNKPLKHRLLNYKNIILSIFTNLIKRIRIRVVKLLQRK